MTTTLVIITPPGLDHLAGLGDIIEPMQIEAFIAQRPIKGLDEGVVGRFAPAREVDAYAIVISPQIYHLTGKFRAVVRWEAVMASD